MSREPQPPDSSGSILRTFGLCKKWRLQSRAYGIHCDLFESKVFGVWFPIVMDWQAALSFNPVAAEETVLRSKGKFLGSAPCVSFSCRTLK